MSKDAYTAVIVGFAHVHINDVAAHFAASPRIRLSDCADVPPLTPEMRTAPYTRDWNIDYCAKKFGLKVWEDWRKMLDAVQPDLCVVNSENARHVEIATECARRGIGVCLEKPMSTNFPDALKMYRAARVNNTLLMINWPVAWRYGFHTAKKMIDSGAVGNLIEIKTRMGHTGPLGWGLSQSGVDEKTGAMTGAEKASVWWYQNAAGGGAMADYCCYGCLVARWFAGEQAVAASGMRINSGMPLGDAEDNAVMVARFTNMYAVIEGSWTTFHHTFKSPIVYGDAGSIVVDYTNGQITLYRAGETPEEIKGEAAPPNLQTPAAAYIHHMDTGEPLHELLCAELNLDAHSMLDAGIRSASSGKVELVNNIKWQIG